MDTVNTVNPDNNQSSDQSRRAGQPPTPGYSRFIPLILISAALLLVIVSGIISWRVHDQNRAFEAGVTQTIQAIVDSATRTAQALLTTTPTARSRTLTPTPTP